MTDAAAARLGAVPLWPTMLAIAITVGSHESFSAKPDRHPLPPSVA